MPPKKASEAGEETEDPTLFSPDGISSSRSTHSREKLKLTEQIVLDHFGPVAALVSSVLLERGRLTLREIERFVAMQNQSSTYSTNPARSQILHAVLSLIQHNCLWHIRLDLDGTLIKDVDEPGGTEYYEIVPDAILTRARFGRYLQIAEQLWGQEGLDIITLVLQNGKLQVRDLLGQLPSQSSSAAALLTHMLLSAYLKPTTVLTHLSPGDVKLAYINEAKRMARGIPNAKELREIEGKVVLRILKEREDSTTTGCLPRAQGDKGAFSSKAARGGKGRNGKTASTKSSKRRKLAVEGEDLSSEDDSHDGDSKGGRVDDADSGQKSSRGSGARGKTNGSSQNGHLPKVASAVGDWVKALSKHEQDRLNEHLVDENVFVRINYDRFDVHVRDEVLRELVSGTFNEAAAEVYTAIAKASEARLTDENKWPSVKDARSEAVSLTLLASTLAAPRVLGRGIDKDMFVSMSGSSKPSRYEFLSEYVAVLSRVEDIMARSEDRVKALTSSSEVPNFRTAIRFLVPGTTNSSADTTTVTGSRISSAVAIDYQSAGRKIKWNLLKRTVQAVFGDSEARVLGVLRREGRVDEKHISKLALISLSDTREACSRLFSNSLISLQEVPRGADRNPQRTFFLYFLDYPRALAWLTDHVYKTQGRLAQRREWERDRERALLKKIERTDVQTEGVQNVLTKVEQERLRRCQDKLRLLTVEEQRVERESWILGRLRG
ncbi:unnamed protein product [Parajaminaea phylloscopi]